MSVCVVDRACREGMSSRPSDFVGAPNYRSRVTLAFALPCDGSSIVQVRAGPPNFKKSPS